MGGCLLANRSMHYARAPFFDQCLKQDALRGSRVESLRPQGTQSHEVKTAQLRTVCDNADETRDGQLWAVGDV